VAWYCALPEGSTSCSLDTPIGINQQPTAEVARMLAAAPGALRIAVLLKAPQSGSVGIGVSSPAVVSYPFDPVMITPVPAAPPAPAVSYRTSTPGSYTVSTGPAHSGTWIVLADSYAPRWTLRGLPAGWRAQHLRVDGYANGWLLTGPGTPRLNLRLDYGPDRYVRLAEEISLAVAGAPPKQEGSRCPFNPGPPGLSPSRARQQTPSPGGSRSSCPPRTPPARSGPACAASGRRRGSRSR
jgi:hypothetical protein